MEQPLREGAGAHESRVYNWCNPSVIRRGGHPKTMSNSAEEPPKWMGEPARTPSGSRKPEKNRTTERANPLNSRPTSQESLHVPAVLLQLLQGLVAVVRKALPTRQLAVAHLEFTAIPFDHADGGLEPQL